MLTNTNEIKIVNPHEVDGIIENCKVPSTIFKKEGTVWNCASCNATYIVDFQWTRGAMAGLSHGGKVWVQVG